MTRIPVPAQLVLLGVLTVLLAVFALVFQFAYIGPVPIPVGSVALLAALPWLVRVVTELRPSLLAAVSPTLLWLLVTLLVLVLGMGGSPVVASTWLTVAGLVAGTWQTPLLLLTGIMVGLFSVQAAVDRIIAARAGRTA